MASRIEDVQLCRCPSNIVHRLERECPSEDARCRALGFPNGVLLVLFCFMLLMDVANVLLLFVPSQRNGDVESLDYGSELQFSVEDGIMERRRATWAMSVEYRTSFGEGMSIRGCTLSSIMPNGVLVVLLCFMALMDLANVIL
ncbi:hypothetical protein CDAR_116561 [Caerostris darwini]|uniref:Uncharacterized protein n=1 Tax=Caerostris darwini TaxID=1538125 RepID=A0AAV4ML87_9ARAC|nr:hypothetical protein CDAR_116561 [Caerostris darwini]